MKRSVFIIIGGIVGFLVAAITIGYITKHGLFKSSVLITTPPYYGYYRCKNSDSGLGAGLLILRINSEGISNIFLENLSDDPATGKVVESIKYKITHIDSLNTVTRIQGTMFGTGVRTTSFDSTPPETTYSTRHFTLDWKQGENGKPDSVKLTLTDEDVNMGVLYFERKL